MPSSRANKDNRTTSRLTNRFGFDGAVRGGKLAAGHGGKGGIGSRAKIEVPTKRAKSMRSILALTQGCCFLVRGPGWRRVSQGGGNMDSEEDRKVGCESTAIRERLLYGNVGL